VKNREDIGVASLVWQWPSGIHWAQGKVVQQLGYQHSFFGFDRPILPGTDIVLVQGPYGTLLPLARQLAACPSAERPVLAYWFQQSLDMRRPDWLRCHLGRTLSDLSRSDGEAGWTGHILDRVAPHLVNSRGRRLGFLGDILWLHRRQLLDVLALSSTYYADYLAHHGIASILVPRGYYPDYGEVRNLERDLAVVWMGKTRNAHRKRAVYWLREELEKRGQVMQIYDGEENPFIFGEQRTQVLNRAWFALNVYPDPTCELSIRFYVAAANGAVVLTEPGRNRYPFIPGKHLVECPIEEMPDTVMYYLSHEEEWRSLSQEMLRLVTSELTLERSIATILAQAENALANR
jgi:hypothetical protein